MNTWNVSKWMSEMTKTATKVFHAVTEGPEDAVKFGNKTFTKNPAVNCNSKHEIQGFHTISDKANKNAHALTDHIIVDFRGRDTDEWHWVSGDCWYCVGWWDTSPNNDFGDKHGVDIKIEHEGAEMYSFPMYGTTSGNGWVSSSPYLIKEPGTYTLYSRYLQAHTCGGPKQGEGWQKIGSFTAKEAIEDCYYLGRWEGANVGECGDCLDGYKEDADGKCQIESSGGGFGGLGGGGSSGGMDMQMPLIMGGVLLLGLIIKKRRSRSESE